MGDTNMCKTYMTRHVPNIKSNVKPHDYIP